MSSTCVVAMSGYSTMQLANPMFLLSRLIRLLNQYQTVAHHSIIGNFKRMSSQEWMPSICNTQKGAIVFLFVASGDVAAIVLVAAFTRGGLGRPHQRNNHIDDDSWVSPGLAECIALVGAIYGGSSEFAAKVGTITVFVPRVAHSWYGMQRCVIHRGIKTVGVG